MTDALFQFDLSEAFVRLARPPIVEAAIRWQARAQNVLEPESLAEALAQKLPQYPVSERIQHMELSATVSSKESSSVVSQRQGWRGIRLKSEDGSHVIQFTRDGMVFRRTKDYEHWEAFSEAAKEAWRAFVEVAAPLEISRLGVRYINHIPGATPATLEHYLRDTPTCPSNLPLKEFVYQSTFALPDHPLEVRVIKVMQPPMPEVQPSSGLFLDIDVYATKSIANDPPAVDEALNQMRWLKNKVFFTLLTTQVIQAFS